MNAVRLGFQWHSQNGGKKKGYFVISFMIVRDNGPTGILQSCYTGSLTPAVTHWTNHQVLTSQIQ